MTRHTKNTAVNRLGTKIKSSFQVREKWIVIWVVFVRKHIRSSKGFSVGSIFRILAVFVQAAFGPNS